GNRNGRCESRVAHGEDFGQNVPLLFPRDNVKPHAENVGVLAVMFLGRRVSDQTIPFIPAQLANGIHGARLCLTIPSRTNRIPEGELQLCAITERFNELERDDRRSAVCVLGRHTEAEVFSPVDKGPPRYVPEESAWPLPIEKPIQNGSRARYLRFDEFFVGAIPPKILDHADPQ